MRLSLVAPFVISSILVSGCGKSGTSRSSQTVTVAPDNSLSISAYITLGVPAPDRPWSSDDYARSLKALQDLAGKDSTKLPRAGSTRSGELFARFVNLDNFSILVNTNLSVEQRISWIGSYLGGLNNILRLYVTLTYKPGSPVFDRELAELIPTSLAVQHIMFTGADEFRSKLSPSDAKSPEREAGFAQMKSGLVQSIDGALLALTEKDQFRLSERIRMARSLRNVLPPLMPRVGKYSHREFYERVKASAANERDTEFKASLDQLAESIHPTSPP